MAYVNVPDPVFLEGIAVRIAESDNGYVGVAIMPVGMLGSDWSLHEDFTTCLVSTMGRKQLSKATVHTAPATRTFGQVSRGVGSIGTRLLHWTCSMCGVLAS